MVGIQECTNDKEVQDFSRCTMVELLDFKEMVEEIYGLGVFDKIVVEDVAGMVTLFETKNNIVV